MAREEIYHLDMSSAAYSCEELISYETAGMADTFDGTRGWLDAGGLVFEEKAGFGESTGYAGSDLLSETRWARSACSPGEGRSSRTCRVWLTPGESHVEAASEETRKRYKMRIEVNSMSTSGNAPGSARFTPLKQ